MPPPTHSAFVNKRRRILYVENGIGYGGAIICLRHLVRNLDRDRFLPTVVTSRTGPYYQEIAKEADWKHIPDKHVDVDSLRRRIGEASWMGSVPGLQFLLNQVVARIDDFANFCPFCVRFLWMAFRLRPSLLHVNNEPLSNRAAILSGKLLRIPVICHVRGHDKNSALTQWLYRLPDHFIPVSKWILKGIGRLGIPDDRCTVVYDGIALEDLNLNADGAAFRRLYGVPQDAFAVGLVGLLIPWKGQHLFLDAAKQLSKEIPDLRMLIIGGTPDNCVPYEEELKRRVRKENLQEVIVFTGHVNDMCEVYNGLDVVVSASTSPEPLGTVVIECMALGRPLVAPNHGGAAEMAENEVSALLFHPGDAANLAASIRRLYENPDLQLKLGKAAREKALRTFDVGKHVRKVQKIYEQVLHEKNGSTVFYAH